jgi:voltage-gated potassium channel Kch
VPVFVARVLRRFLLRQRTGILPAALIIVVFVVSWPLMALAEPAGAAIVAPANYWWWFLVTASTVGYGDFYPTTAAGHAIGVAVIVGGIATLTTLFAQLASALERARGRRMKGTVTVNLADHIVVLGYHPGRTERIIEELHADTDRPIVLCAWEEVTTHPMPEQDVTFVRGDLTDDEVARRAGVHRARSILLDARDDNEALALLVTVDHVAPQAHLVVGLRDMAGAARMRYVNSAVYCVQWHSPRMLTEELQSPGISQVYTDLMTHGGSNTYSIRLPDSIAPVAFGDCQLAFGRQRGATILAARTGGEMLVSPAWSTSLPPGSTLYYVCQQPVTAAQLVELLRRP